MAYEQTGLGWRTSWSLYINGEFRSVVSVEQLVAVRNGEFSVGQSGLEHFIEPFEGLVDEVRLWSRVRTAEEIQASYSMSSVKSHGLLGHWSFDVATPSGGLHQTRLSHAVAQLPAPLRDAATVVPDLSGEGHTGLLQVGLSKDPLLFGDPALFGPRVVPFAPQDLL